MTDAPIPTLTALAGLVEALEVLQRFAKKPMNSWDAGRVIDAQRVEEVAEDALAVWRTRLPMAEDAELRTELRDIMIGRFGDADDPSVGEVLEACDAALDARMGKS